MTLLELFALLKKHLKLVISLPIACALATAVFSWAFLPNTYSPRAWGTHGLRMPVDGQGRLGL